MEKRGSLFRNRLPISEKMIGFLNFTWIICRCENSSVCSEKEKPVQPSMEPKKTTKKKPQSAGRPVKFRGLSVGQTLQHLAAVNNKAKTSSSETESSDDSEQQRIQSPTNKKTQANVRQKENTEKHQSDSKRASTKFAAGIKRKVSSGDDSSSSDDSSGLEAKKTKVAEVTKTTEMPRAPQQPVTPAQQAKLKNRDDNEDENEAMDLSCGDTEDTPKDTEKGKRKRRRRRRKRTEEISSENPKKKPDWKPKFTRVAAPAPVATVGKKHVMFDSDGEAVDDTKETREESKAQPTGVINSTNTTAEMPNHGPPTPRGSSSAMGQSQEDNVNRWAWSNGGVHPVSRQGQGYSQGHVDRKSPAVPAQKSTRGRGGQDAQNLFAQTQVFNRKRLVWFRSPTQGPFTCYISAILGVPNLTMRQRCSLLVPKSDQ